MRYFDETEKTKKSRHLAGHPRWAQRLFDKTPTVHDLYDDLLMPCVGRDSVLLDAGCGKKGIMNKYKGRFKYAVGVDLALSAIKQNTALDDFAVGRLDSLPFRDETFDVIISAWAVEHLSDPAASFREFHRVLKNGGTMIAVTNSIYCPLMFFNAILSEKIRDRIKGRLLPAEIDEDTFPTYYRCNSLWRMRRVLRQIGFTKVHDAYIGDVSFFIFSRVIFPLLLFYEWVTAIPFLRKLRMHVVVHYTKASSGDQHVAGLS